MFVNFFLFAEAQERFFIASTHEYSRIITQLEKVTGDNYSQQWERFRKKWTRPSNGQTAKAKLEVIFGGNVQSNCADVEKKAAKRGKPENYVWELNATIKQWRRAPLRNYEHAGLSKTVSKNISWIDCPFKEICVNHKMTAEELNTAQMNYPKFHNKETKYRTVAVEHLFCNVGKYSYTSPGKRGQVATGYPHVVKYKNRTQGHTFPGPHASNYNYLLWILYVIYLFFYVMSMYSVCVIHVCLMLKLNVYIQKSILGVTIDETGTY